MAKKLSSATKDTTAKAPVEIIPFVECYTNENRQAVISGLHAWWRSPYVTRAIVVTGPGYKGLAKLPKRGETPLDIIAGLKTLSLLNKNWSEGWDKVGDYFHAAFEITGVKIAVLENETALKTFSEQGQSLDSRAMFEGIKLVPGEPWVYLPEVLCDSKAHPNRERESGDYVRALAGGNKAASFVTGYAAHPRATVDKEVQRLRSVMVQRVGERRMIPMLNVRINPQPGRFQPFSIAQAKKHIAATGGIHLVQPGLDEFERVATEWRITA